MPHSVQRQSRQIDRINKRMTVAVTVRGRSRKPNPAASPMMAEESNPRAITIGNRLGRKTRQRRVSVAAKRKSLGSFM